jgi:hypothetical protein
MEVVERKYEGTQREWAAVKMSQEDAGRRATRRDDP